MKPMNGILYLGLCSVVATWIPMTGGRSTAGEYKPPAFDSLQPRLEALWENTPWAVGTVEHQGKTFRKWFFRINKLLPFPDPWPPAAGGSLVFYVHAVQFTTNPAGAEIQWEPWARIIQRRNGELQVEALPVSFRKLGSQGVRPLRSEEIAVLAYEEEVFRFVGGIESLPDEGDVRSEKTRAWYCQWLLNNGLLAAVYEAYHPGFYAWLRCASK
jgi:hypothetical protein